MSKKYDQIIAGGGSAGCVVAARLSEDPSVSVLVIEAGPDFPTVEQLPKDIHNAFAVSVQDHDCHYTAEAFPGRTIDYARGKCTGGCSAINGTIALRGLPSDYDEWAAWGNDEWSWDKLLPYFKKIESDPIGGPYHGTDGPIPIARNRREDAWHIQQAFVDACVANGFDWVEDHNAPDATGVGPIPMNRKGDLRVSSAVGYFTPEVRQRKNLTILDNTTTLKIVFEGKKAIGVEVRGADGKVETILGDHITVSAGTVNSPALLMRSGVGPADQLKALGIAVVHDNPAVGKNVKEHCLSLVALYPKEGVCSQDSTDVEMVVHYTAPGGPSGDMQIYCINKLGAERFPELKGYDGLLYAPMIVLNRPASSGVISLTSADPDVQPKIELNLNSDPDDMRRMRAGVRKCWDIAHTGAFQEKSTGVAILTQEIIDDDAKLTEYVQKTCATIWHPVGSCKMGPAGDETAVVDQHLRVHGVENLRVADGSIFPNHVSRNPNLTVLVTGERCAEYIQQELGSRTASQAR